LHRFVNLYIKLLYILIFLLITGIGDAQNVIDSLKNELSNTKNTYSQIKLSINIADRYNDINIDSSLIYLNQSKNLLKENPDTYLKGRYHKVYGQYLNRNNQNDEAILQYKQSVSIFTEADSLSEIPYLFNLTAGCFKDKAEYDSALSYFQISMSLIDSVNNLSLLAANYNNIAIVYNEINRNDEALIYYLTALTIFRKLQRLKAVAITLNNIGLVNIDLENYSKAIGYFKEAIELSIKSDDIYNLCLSYNSLGIAYKNLQDYENAKHYLMLAVIKSEEAGFIGLIAQSSHNLGSVYSRMQNYDSAIILDKKSLRICKKLDIIFGEIYNLLDIGEVYLKLEQFDSAKMYFHNALELSITHNSYNIINKIYQSLFRVYELTGNYKKAVEYHNLYDAIRDSLDVVERTNKLNELQTKYETEHKELENQQLKNQNKINELIILRQRIGVIAISFIIVLSLIILVLLIITRVKRRKQHIILQEKNIQIEEKSIELIKTNETKDKLFSIIAHDLRSPFTSLLGFSSLLNEEVKSGDYNNVNYYSQQLLSISNSAYELVDNLLNWSRSQQEMIVAKFKSIPLIDLVNNTVTVLMPKAEQKQISIKVNVNSDIRVFCDSNMLMLILRNLISNAIKFTNKGGNIEIGCVEKPDHYIIFVKDDGIGINSDTTDSMFKNTIGFTTTGTESEQGSGLGLLLIKDFVNKLNGEIWVESTPEKGSTFSFSIPKEKS